MQPGYITLSAAAVLLVLASSILYFLDKRTPFGKLNKVTKQIIFGIIFGGFAILGTEWGIPVNNAQVNCRDAAVLIAGLMFGWPAGIIAGLIGGIERWIAVAWGVGTFTRVACSVSTIIAGFYSALLRKFMFEDKKPGWLLAFAIGVVMEVFHLTMVFITNMATPDKAMAVVAACSTPMIIANAFAVMLSCILITFISGRKNKNGEKVKHQARIAQTIQKWLLITVLFAFVTTSFFVFRLQDAIAIEQRNILLDNALNEAEATIKDTSDRTLLSLTHTVLKDVGSTDLKQLAKKHDVAEIDIVNKDGIITDSSNPTFIGYDMASGKQSAEFLCLLAGVSEYVQEYGPISYNSIISRKYAGVKTDDGFIQVGYDAQQLQNAISKDIVGITKNYHVGQNGYVIIADKDLNILSLPDSSLINTLKSDLSKIFLPKEDQALNANMAYEDSCLKCRKINGYSIIAIMPEKDVLYTRNIVLYVNTYMEILVFAIMFALIFMLIKRVVVNQIKTINGSLAKITEGDLTEVVDVRSNEEFSSLSDDINRTVDTLKKYIDEASKRIDAELEFAKNIQKSALPNVFPAYPKRKDFDIFASMNPAKEVGGDFYDFYMTDSNTLNFLVADVSGKGIPAAMFMMRAKTELKSLTEAQMKLADVFTHSNTALCEGNDAGMFVTAWQGQIDLKTGILSFANAGHNPPIIKKADGTVEMIKAKAGFVLAGMDGFPYKTQEIQLSPGDTVYLYTDGVTEATNSDNELYGDDRLLSAISSQDFEDVKSMCEYVKKDVDAFQGDAPQFDDITMVAFKYIGTPPVPFVHLEKAHLEDISVVTEFVETELEKLNCPMKAVIQINVAIDEIFSNIVRYGYKDTEGPITVKLIAKEDEKSVRIRFEDEGIPYNPLTRDDPDVTLSAEERSIGGLGIFMVKKTMDDIKYKYENDKNILTIEKKFEV